MRHSLTILLLVLTTIVAGQKKEKFQLMLQLQPELTIHKNDYANTLTDKKDVGTFNIGINASLQYKLSNNIYLDLGLGYISRRLRTIVFVDQSKLPQPFYDSIQLGLQTESVAFRTLQIPLGITYNFMTTKDKVFFLRATYIPNFLLNTKYEVNNYPAFAKNVWQGHSTNFGIGFDYKISTDLTLTNSLLYSLENTVAGDPFTLSQTERAIALNHSFLQFNTGLKIKL